MSASTLLFVVCVAIILLMGWRRPATTLQFEVDGSAVEFSRNSFTGRCTLRTATGEIELQSPWNPFTHFSTELNKRWQASIRGHDIVIEWEHAFIGSRPQTWRILVDGEQVQEQSVQ